MDSAQFDDVIRGLVHRRHSRRDAIRVLVGITLGLFGSQRLAAARTHGLFSKCKKIKNKKRRRKCKKSKGQVPGSPPNSKVATLLAAGDISSCSSNGDEATAVLLDRLPGTVVTLGDTVYEDGSPQQFSQCYDSSWGRHKSRTRPAPGNHDYNTGDAAGYFGYFGTAAGDPDKGYYSYDLGAWHIVSLNSNCSDVGGCGEGSPQVTWLRQDLAAHPAACILAYWHHPRFSFGKYDDSTATQALWETLYDAGAEIVLAGHDHNYQRYAPLTPSGARDDARGIRQFVVGTGGKNHYALGSPPPAVEAHNDDTFGILRLTLREKSYDWEFIPEAGKTFTDSGSGTCHYSQRAYGGRDDGRASSDE